MNGVPDSESAGNPSMSALSALLTESMKLFASTMKSNTDPTSCQTTGVSLLLNGNSNLELATSLLTLLYYNSSMSVLSALVSMKA